MKKHHKDALEALGSGKLLSPRILPSGAKIFEIIQCEIGADGLPSASLGSRDRHSSPLTGKRVDELIATGLVAQIASSAFFGLTEAGNTVAQYLCSWKLHPLTVVPTPEEFHEIAAAVVKDYEPAGPVKFVISPKPRPWMAEAAADCLEAIQILSATTEEFATAVAGAFEQMRFGDPVDTSNVREEPFYRLLGRSIPLMRSVIDARDPKLARSAVARLRAVLEEEGEVGLISALDAMADRQLQPEDEGHKTFKLLFELATGFEQPGEPTEVERPRVTVKEPPLRLPGASLGPR